MGNFGSIGFGSRPAVHEAAGDSRTIDLHLDSEPGYGSTAGAGTSGSGEYQSALSTY